MSTLPLVPPSSSTGSVRALYELRSRRRNVVRKRFLALGIAVLGVLGASMGVSYLGSTGTTTISTTSGGTSSFVYTSGTTPTSTTEYSTTAALKSPIWAPTAGSAGSVTTPGDLAVIDATAATGATDGLDVSVYITNLAALQNDYSSFAFPIDVYTASSATSTTWVQDSSVLSSVTYLTNNSGTVSFDLPAGAYYDITMQVGGSFYCTATTSGDLSPAFFVTAEPY